jgi:hypothetical protein
MSSNPAPSTGATGAALEERLERGEVIYYPACPFPLPQGPDREFLLQQQLAGSAHKNISYDPRKGRIGGILRQSRVQVERARRLLADFSTAVTRWLGQTVPRYASGWRLDQVSFRPVEEATRQLRLTARNDLLHVDAFPSRPTNGHRILRVFANINPCEPRIWVTSDTFGRLLDRYGRDVGLPTGRGTGMLEQVRDSVIRLFRPGRAPRSSYDAFMLRFHNFLKADSDFQERSSKRYWTFPPGSGWMVLTDVCTHAALRGRYALEHSYFIAPAVLALPAESPAALLQRACGFPVLRKAA